MPKTVTPYSTDSLDKALNEAKNGGKLREIARKYGVPKSTLHFKLKNPDHKTSCGPSPYLTQEEEKCLENWILELARKGFPLKKEDLQFSVQKFLTDNPRPNPFKDNYPGEGWVRGFLKRNPAITKRTSEGVTFIHFSSACVSETDIRKWFLEIFQYFQEKDLLAVLNDPRRIFNGDESGFQLCPKTGTVLALKGVKNVYNVETSSSKENMTVMFSFSAAGQSCPPMVIYNYQRIPQKVIESVPSDWGAGRSVNGWMTSEIFFEYIANVFYPYLVREKITLPVIYFLDGHKTHLTYEVSKLCTELKIELVALYPNATRILQPADVAVFRPVKAAWNASTREWLSHNPGHVITKANFAEVLNLALQTSIKAETLINGFKACGLFPFDPNAVDYTKCIPDIQECNDIQTTNVEDKSMTFSQFLHLIGPSKADELKKIRPTDIIIDKNFRILHNVYKGFATTSRPSNLPSTTTHLFPSEQSQKFIDTVNSTSNLTGLQSIDAKLSPPMQPQDFQREKPESSIKIVQDILIPDSNSCGLCPVTGMLNSTKNMTSLEGSSIIPECETDYILCPITGVMIRSLSASAIVSETQNTPTKAESTPHLLLPQASPPFKVRHSDLGSYLTLPKTPERKGKRNIKRMPFAITSEKYKAMYKEKTEKRETDLREKEQRKKAREETKLNKKKEKVFKNLSSCKIQKKEDTQVCKHCSNLTKSSNSVVCDMCSSYYHIKCVPQKHQVHVPQDVSVDLFVCHICYVEDNDENDYEHLFSQSPLPSTSYERKSDDSNTSCEELFAEYLRNKNN